MRNKKNLAIMLSLVFLSAISSLAAEGRAPEIAFVKCDYLKELLGGSWLEVWNSKWPDADRSLYNDAVRKVVENDLKDVKQRYTDYKLFGTPSRVTAVKRNPNNGLIYFLLEPANTDQVLDLNIVYVYNPKEKWFICKTSVDLGQ